MPRNGITEHPERKLQPYSVWFRGQIVRFARTREEAEAALRAEQAREASVRRGASRRRAHEPAINT
jgi:hypothetical protein